MELAYIVYTSIFAVTMFCAYVGRITNGAHVTIQPNKKSKVWMWFGVAIIFYTLTLGLRENVGLDYMSYKLVFNNLIRYTNYRGDLDIIYYMFLPIVKNFHYNFFTAFLAFTTIFFVFKCAEDRMDILLFFLFFFLTFNVFLNSINIARQTSAFFIMFYAINQFLKKKYKKFIIYYILAFALHKSCIIILPFIFVLGYDFIKYRWLQYTLLFVAYFSGFVIFKQISSLFIGMDIFYNIGYEEYVNNFDLWAEKGIERRQEHQGTGLYSLLTLFVDSMVIFYSPKLKHEFRRNHIVLFYNMYLIGAILSYITVFHETMHRLTNNFEMFRIYIYAMFFYYIFKNSKSSVLVKLMCMTIMLLGIVFFYASISRGRGGVAPFHFLNF
ncbi:MAG: EpsG family protein [Bacteroidales bacterium]|jgi:hypothetical protein|nr:EpsG family protein [Bacteroidales bacterium]